MIIDFRYHVASLVAIFIALGLGIFIGSTLVGEDIMENLVKEQKIWIGKLENDYLTLKEETNGLKKQLLEKQVQLNEYENFVLQMKPYLISNKLQEKKFAIIQIGENKNNQELGSLLEQAGAEVVSTISFFISGINKVSDNAVFLEQFSQLVLEGEKGDLINSLEKGNFIRSKGFSDENLDGIIFINNSKIISKTVVDNFLLPIINILRTDFPIYFVETSITKGSVINNIRNISNVYSVDNLETILGEINLIMTLQGGTENSKSQDIISTSFAKEKRDE